MTGGASKEITLLLLDYLKDHQCTETLHMVEKESGVFFDLKYFEECLMNGDWDEAENYLSGFTKLDENQYSFSTFFMIRKQRYLEALYKKDHAKAVQILQKDLKVFSDHNKETYNGLALLLTCDNFWENEQLSKQGNTTFARKNMVGAVKKLIVDNPLFHDKLQYPRFEKSRLRTLINQSLNWQHSLCRNPKEAPDFKTLFHDHSCGPIASYKSPVTKPLKHFLPKAGGVPPIGAHAVTKPSKFSIPKAGGIPSIGAQAVTIPSMHSLPKAGGVPRIGAHGPSQPAAAQDRASLAGRIANQSSVPHSMIPAGPTIPTTPDYAYAENVFTRSRASGVSDEVNNMLRNVLPITSPSHNTHMLYGSDELPKILIANLDQGSAVTSIDFHPQQQSLLLVGTIIGGIALWEVGSKQRLLSRSFKIWDAAACSATLQVSLVHGSTASVNRVIWSPDGRFIGVAYSMHIVHIYSYRGRDDLRDSLEIAAHVGNVNDLAFFDLKKKLCITSCGDDKLVKVWDASTGEKLYTFEGHEAPVFSLYPHMKQNIPFIWSTDINGKIKALVYLERWDPKVHHDTPGGSCIRMAYSSDGERLFSCGTNMKGESCLLEWNEAEGGVKRDYNGLRKRTLGIVKFDTTKNRFLAAGDDCSIKFWGMDNEDLLYSIDAGGGLPASPCVRFNKDGILLAVSTKDNGVKVLANTNGVQSLLEPLGRDRYFTHLVPSSSSSRNK